MEQNKREIEIYSVGFLEGKLQRQAEIVKLIEGMKIKMTDNWAFTHDRDSERFPKLTRYENAYNSALQTLLTAITQEGASPEKE